MDQSIKLRAAWRDKRERGEWPTARKEPVPTGRVEHFRDEEEKQHHLQQVAEAQKNGAPF